MAEWLESAMWKCARAITKGRKQKKLVVVRGWCCGTYFTALMASAVSFSLWLGLPQRVLQGVGGGARGALEGKDSRPSGTKEEDSRSSSAAPNSSFSTAT